MAGTPNRVMEQVARSAGPSRPIYYGWWVLGAAALTEMLAVGSTSYSAGLFVLPVEQELSISRTAANSALPITFVGAALMAPLVGYLLDRFPARWVIAIGALCLALGFTVISATSSIPLMVLSLLIPVAIGGMAIGPLTTSALTCRWFYRRRGRALGIATVATSGGGIFVAPLVSAAIENYGWRTALLTEAVVIVLIVSILAAFVLRSGPAELNLGSHAENRLRPASDMPRSGQIPQGIRPDWPYGRILSALNFWMVGFVLAAISGINQAIVITAVPYATDLGFGPGAAILLISAFSMTAAVVKVGAGVLSEYVERRSILLAANIAMLAALSLLLISSAYPSLVLACCLAGTALGCTLPSAAALVAGFFGAPSFGRVMGLMYVGVLLCSVLASAFIGAVFDRTGEYRVAFLVFLAVALLSALAAFLVQARQRGILAEAQAADLPPTEDPNTVAKGSPP